MPRTITEILKDADAATDLKQLIALWNEIADNKNKRHYALTQIWFANEHIRDLSLKVKGDDFQKGTFYHALKEMYNPF